MQSQCHPFTGINFLPNEILGHIFTLGSSHGTEDKLSLIQERFQELASHVCRHWREIALGSPLLWTSLHIKERTSTQRIRAWLKRSRNSIIHIDIFFNDGGSGIDYNLELLSKNERIDATMEALCDHHERWGTLIVSARYMCHLHLIINHLRGCENPCSLQNLELEHMEGSFIWMVNFRRVSAAEFLIPDCPSPPVFFPNGTPLLKRVSLFALPIKWASTPWLCNLTVLELGYHTANQRPTLAEVITIIRSSPHLEDLKLHMLAIPDKSTMEYFDPIPLKSLKRLHLAFEDETLACDFLPFMIMESLVSLSLSCAIGHCDRLMIMLLCPPNPQRSILNTLHRLHFNKISLCDVHPESIFSTLTNLRGLELQNSASSWLDCLMESGKSSTKPVYMKQLEELMIIGAPGRQICDFVRKRIEDRVPIRRLRYHANDLEDEDVQWLKAEIDFCDDLCEIVTAEVIL